MNIRKNPAILNELKELIDGLMLSDGYIKKPYSLTAGSSYTQCCVDYEWLLHIKERFDEFGVLSNIYHKSNNISSSVNKRNVYMLYTLCYSEFELLRSIWYRLLTVSGNNYYKRVPDSVIFSKECVANWFFGDGSSRVIDYKSPIRISFATQGFNKNDVEKLSSKLNNTVNIRSCVSEEYHKKTDKMYYIIKIASRDSAMRFFEYIDGYRISCFDYKFPVITERFRL